MKKILFVCLGNICRSPLAHGVAEDIIRKKHLDFDVDSAGTSHWHNGEAPCENSIKVAKTHGIDIAKQISRNIEEEDIETYDYVFAMDRQNKEDLEAFGFKNVYLLGDFAHLNGVNVPDPYFFTGQSVKFGFEKVYTMIATCVEDILRKIEDGSL
jgi:protein-tyrosine phosphatase